MNAASARRRRDNVPRPEHRRCKPLAVSLAALLGTAPCSAALAATFLVTNCNDAGTGSLRDTVAAATATPNYLNDIQFNLPMSCSAITLITGAIPITQPGILGIAAPGPGKLGISGANQDRIFKVTQRGAFLELTNLNLYFGFAHGATSVAGGCIYSLGEVVLRSSMVGGCEANGTYAYGGAVWTGNGLRLYDSQIVSNVAYGTYAYGGGIYSTNVVTIQRSTISSNVAEGALVSSGGGISVSTGGGEIDYSTISDNVVEPAIGGVGKNAGAAFYGGTLVLNRSTISRNFNSGGAGGGLRSSAARTYIYDSTIAFNYASAGVDSGGHSLAPGLAMTAGTLLMYNTLMSNNRYGSARNDFSTVAGISVTGSNNLVGTATGGLPPAGLIIGCALLGPLRDNGGATQTHALLSRSPAIDHGTNNIPGRSLTRDQRGFPAPSPAGGVVDIGAYEVQQNEIVFNAGFDGC